jgi:hypothetical protein
VYLGTEQVHIAFQGYERERVYRPPIESNADKVILIAHNGETVSNSEESAEESIDEDISKGRACRDEVRRKLEEEDIDVEITECDFFDLNSAVLGAGDVITRYQSDNTEIYLNITTGSKITAIAGAIAATSTDATPYYVRAESYYGEQIATDIQDPQTLPQYPFSSPHRDFLRVLEFIQEEATDRGYVIKREVVEFSMDLSLLSEYERSEVRHYYDPADEKVLDPLLEWGYVKMIPRGDENRYQLTDEGEDILEVLSFMLN